LATINAGFLAACVRFAAIASCNIQNTSAGKTSLEKTSLEKTSLAPHAGALRWQKPSAHLFKVLQARTGAHNEPHFPKPSQGHRYFRTGRQVRCSDAVGARRRCSGCRDCPSGCLTTDDDCTKKFSQEKGPSAELTGLFLGSVFFSRRRSDDGARG
jgi:hypothetical protein